jgi:hypothetical protein
MDKRPRTFRFGDETDTRTRFSLFGPEQRLLLAPTWPRLEAKQPRQPVTATAVRDPQRLDDHVLFERQRRDPDDAGDRDALQSQRGFVGGPERLAGRLSLLGNSGGINRLSPDRKLLCDGVMHLLRRGWVDRATDAGKAGLHLHRLDRLSQ